MPFDAFPAPSPRRRRQRVIVKLRIALSTFQDGRETPPKAPPSPSGDGLEIPPFLRRISRNGGGAS